MGLIKAVLITKGLMHLLSLNPVSGDVRWVSVSDRGGGLVCMGLVLGCHWLLNPSAKVPVPRRRFLFVQGFGKSNQIAVLD